MKKLEDYVISVPDFPEKGVLFRDVTGILQDAQGLKLAIDTLQGMLDGLDFDLIAGAESRGFLFGMPVAYNLGRPFVPVRKKGKLPRAVYTKEYQLEYGTAALEVHRDAVKPGQKVVIIDDLIATGGTVRAMAELLEEMGAEIVKICFLMELAGLKGREKLAGYDVESAIVYEGK